MTISSPARASMARKMPASCVWKARTIVQDGDVIHFRFNV